LPGRVARYAIATMTYPLTAPNGAMRIVYTTGCGVRLGVASTMGA
jgi:hypothetical protein